MVRYLIQRLTLVVPVMLGVTLVAFVILHLTPGDPVRVLLGFGETIAEGTPAAVQAHPDVRRVYLGEGYDAAV